VYILFRRYPTRVPICISVRVCERAIAIRTLHTRQFIITIITDRFYSSVFFPVVVLFSFLIRTRRLTIIQQRLRGRSSGKLDHPATIRRWQRIPYYAYLQRIHIMLCRLHYT